jgi:hypothetical protein
VLVLAAAVGLVLTQQQRLRDSRDSSQRAAARADQRAEQAGARADRIATVLAAPDVRLKTAAVGTGRVTVAVSDSMNTGVVALSGLPKAGSGRVYQLWVIRAGNPASAGLVGSSVATQVLPDVHAAATVAMTREPSGGSRQPTTPTLFALPLR